MGHYYFGLNRTICDVLEEMRKCNSTRNYSSLESLIEEAQMMANRMEAGLNDKKDLRRMHEEAKELKAEIKKLEKKKKDLS